MSPRPPGLFRALVERAVPRNGAVGPSLIGDLHEEWASIRARRGGIVAGAWYAWHASRIALRFLAATLSSAVVRGARELGRGVGLDVRHAVRGLARTPTTSAVAIASLGIGIGLTTVAASFVVGTWFPRLDYPAHERLMELGDAAPQGPCPGCWYGTSMRSFLEWRQELPVFERIEASSRWFATMRHGEEISDLVVAAVSGGYAELFGLRAARGRLIGPSDDRPEAPAVAVLDHALWTARWGGDPDVLGTTVELDGTAHVVVGVLAPGTRPLDRSRILVALGPRTANGGGSYDERHLRAFALRAPSTAPPAAAERLAAFAAARYDADPALEPGWTARARPLAESFRASAGSGAAAATLVAGPLLVLLIAVLNLAALLLARVTDRRHELGLRAALGAGRAGLARAAVLESVVLAGAGGLAGVALAWAGVGLLSSWTAGGRPGWVEFQLDPRVVGTALALTLGTALLCAAFPLAKAWRLDPARVTGRSPRHRGPGRSLRQDLFLAGQIAFGMVLLAGATTGARILQQASDFDTLGHRWKGLGTVVMDLPADRELDPEARGELARRLRAGLAAQPAVAAASASIFLTPGRLGADGTWGAVRVPGTATPLPWARTPRSLRVVLPGWLELLEIQVLAGRTFVEDDRRAGEPAMVVSEVAARALWPDRSLRDVPGGQLLLSDGSEEHPFTVVGVVGDVVRHAADRARTPEPRLYTLLSSTPEPLVAAWSTGRIAATVDLPASGVGTVRWEEVVRRVDPALEVRSTASYEVTLSDHLASLRTAAAGMGALALLATALLALGVYGTVAYRVASARHEIGVRMALGAKASRVVRSVTGRLVRVFGLSVGAGALLSIPAALAAREAGLQVGSSDIPLLLVVVVLLAAVTAAGSLGPVRRALRVDPIESLRTE